MNAKASGRLDVYSQGKQGTAETTPKSQRGEYAICHVTTMIAPVAAIKTRRAIVFVDPQSLMYDDTPPAQGGIQILAPLLCNAASPGRDTNPGHHMWARIRVPCALFGKRCERCGRRPQNAASPGRDTNPGHNITRFSGLQSLCEVMSTFPAGATECHRCFRDFRKEDRQWDVGSTSDGNSTACQSGKFDADPDASSAWLHDPLGQTVDKAIRMFKKQSRVDPAVAIALTEELRILFGPVVCDRDHHVF